MNRKIITNERGTQLYFDDDNENRTHIGEIPDKLLDKWNEYESMEIKKIKGKTTPRIYRNIFLSFLKENKQ